MQPTLGWPNHAHTMTHHDTREVECQVEIPRCLLPESLGDLRLLRIVSPFSLHSTHLHIRKQSLHTPLSEALACSTTDTTTTMRALALVGPPTEREDSIEPDPCETSPLCGPRGSTLDAERPAPSPASLISTPSILITSSHLQVSFMSMRMDSRSPFDRRLELLPPPDAPTPFEVELAAKLLAAERRNAGSVTPNAARRSRFAPAAAEEETREERKERLQRRVAQVYRSAAALSERGRKREREEGVAVTLCTDLQPQ